MRQLQGFFKVILTIALLAGVQIYSYGVQVSSWTYFQESYQSGTGDIIILGNSNLMKATGVGSLGIPATGITGISASASLSKIDGNSLFAGMNFTGTIPSFTFKSLIFSNFIKNISNFDDIIENAAKFRGSVIYFANAGSGMLDFSSFRGQTSFQFNSQFTGNRVIVNQSTSQAAGGALFVSAVVDAESAAAADVTVTTLNFHKLDTPKDSSYLGFSNNGVSINNALAQAQGGALYASGNVNAIVASNHNYIAEVIFSTVTANGEGGTSEHSNKINSNYVVANGANSQAQGGAFFAAGVVANADLNANGANVGSVLVNIYSSNMLFESNNIIARGKNSQAQGGALFFAGAVNNSDKEQQLGAVAPSSLSFYGSTVAFYRNYIQAGANNIQVQGGGVFIGGLVSLGGTPSSGTAKAIFEGSAISFTQNSLAINSYSQAQGGGLFI
ncbi:MAG: hypothetical protein LBB93_04090, partial [Elusimicrobiota bacterium]|nr:hypothetical protein [Elusimicrobiota bacterium]